MLEKLVGTIGSILQAKVHKQAWKVDDLENGTKS
jgi:hypothetical protein